MDSTRACPAEPPGRFGGLVLFGRRCSAFGGGFSLFRRPVPILDGVAAPVPTTLRVGFAKPVGDVALRSGGVLEGQVVCGGDLAPDVLVAGLPVALLHGRQTVAQTRTDVDGRFVFRNLSGGLYRVLVETRNGQSAETPQGPLVPTLDVGTLPATETVEETTCAKRGPADSAPGRAPGQGN